VSDLTHFDDSGAARMVDTTAKPETEREARASALVRMAAATLATIRAGTAAKGDVLGVARLAGILAAKRTDELIPLCHSLPITGAVVDFSFPDETTLRIDATVRTFGRTGVEMEALTAASIAALTVYDMCKAIDRVMTVERVRLESKKGGKSGPWVAPQ
jgi:cyclic pyranopterin phosphate synthase